ncbi:porin family protein [Alteromonas sp. a30]|uniref:porin family protein n=1 Tax=Alteromonas sp. a30 TaxID=2730917 RepID=UPI002281EE2D|nr:porin family protein [Alteromonas sp. a30]MCY7295464.1 DUF560 domain-containing protein [Alteromonas sp. a30]
MVHNNKSINTLKTCFSIILLTLVFSAKAQEDTSASLKTLSNLIQVQSYEDAHKLGQELMFDLAGEPYFDFLIGQAAYYTQHYQEAIFAFERVVINQPNHDAARALLAFSYFKAKNYGAAEKELTTLNQSKSLSAQQQNQVQTYLQQIIEIKNKQVTDSQFDISLGFGYDSNASSGTEEDTLFFPALGDFITLTNGLETSDTLAELGIHYRVKKKRSQNSSYQFAAGFQHLQHRDVSEFDRSLLNLNASFNDRWGKTDYSVTGYLQPMLLDDSYYRVAYGLIGELSWRISPKTRWAVSSTLARINNAVLDNFDMKRWGMATRITFLTAHPQIISLSYHNDDSDKLVGEHNGKDNYSIAYSYLYPASNQLSMGFHLYADKNQYDAPHPTFLTVREDDSYTASVTTDYKMNRRWALSTLLRYSKKNSNLALYDYDRSEVKVTIKHIF